MKLRKRVLASAIIVALVALAGGAGFLASRSTPDFYRAAVTIPPEKLKAASDQLLENAAALSSQARQNGEWRALFTAEQINGWLAVDFVKNHPKALPKESSEPRVLLRAQGATIAWRYRKGAVDTIVSLDADLFLHEPNVIGVRLQGFKAGALPMPLGRLITAAEAAAVKAGLKLEWSTSEGAPVALVTLPKIRGAKGHDLLLENVVVRDGELYVAGHTAPAATSSGRDGKSNAMAAAVQAFLNSNLQP